MHGWKAPLSLDWVKALAGHVGLVLMLLHDLYGQRSPRSDKVVPIKAPGGPQNRNVAVPL